jgi:hypothetical protein
MREIASGSVVDAAPGTGVRHRRGRLGTSSRSPAAVILHESAIRAVLLAP